MVAQNDKILPVAISPEPNVETHTLPPDERCSPLRLPTQMVRPCRDRPPGRSATDRIAISPKSHVKTHPYIFPHVIARAFMPVAIRIPLAGLLVGGSTGVRIATGLATLAMTCGSLNCCVFARVPFETAQCTARTVREAGPYDSRRAWYRTDRPGGRSLHFRRTWYRRGRKCRGQ